MEAITRLLTWIRDNWTAIVAIIGLLYAIYLKAKKTWEDWQKMTEEEKQKELERQIEVAKKILAELILSLVSRAEIEWQDEGAKLGPIKRAQVIEEIFENLPVLSYVTDQEELLAYIDELIDKALVTVSQEMYKHFSKHAKLYRTGGDEFMAIFKKGNFDFIEGLVNNFQEDLKKTEYRVACGIASYTPGDDIEKIITICDERMYSNKIKIKKEEGFKVI